MHNTTLNHFTPDLQLDASGLRCPIPIMRTKKELSKLAFGQILLVIATDPSFRLDCMVFIRQSGHLLLQSWQEAEKIYFVVQHNQRATEAT